MLALPFLPENKIRPMFNRLDVQRQAPVSLQPALITCPATGSTAPPGALQIGPCLRKQWGQILTSRGSTMASTAEPPDVDSCPCTSLFSYCTKRPNLLPCRSALFQTGNSEESKDASTVTSRPDCSACGMNTRSTYGQPSGCWKPALT